jgi:hypothetical protein
VSAVLFPLHVEEEEERREAKGDTARITFFSKLSEFKSYPHEISHTDKK